MDRLNVLISLLSKTEQNAFVNYLKKRNKRKDTKNIQLFNAIKSGHSDQIRSTMNNNAFNILKKRLSDQLVNYTTNQIIEKEQTDAIEIIKHIVLSQKLFKHKQYKTAFWQLKKAESKAKSVGDHHALNEIYQIFIQYSYHPLSPDQEDLFTAFEQNKKAYLNGANLNIVYASVRKAFQYHNYQQKPINLDHLISNNLKRFGIPESIGYTFKTLNQIAMIADIEGSFNRNYFKIDLFFEKYLTKLKGGPTDTEKELIDHINLLYLMGNIYFRKKNFKKSILYLKDMQSQMRRYDNKYYDLFDTLHTTLLALNYNFIGEPIKAADLLDQLSARTNLMNTEKPDHFLAILTRIMIYFQQEEFKIAKQLLAKLNHQDSWYIKHIGLEWLLNKKFIEILLEIELGSISYVDVLINRLMRKQDVYFTGASTSALHFLKLIEAYHKNPENVEKQEFKTRVESTFNWKPTEEEDLFFISYYSWLKSKMIKKPLYEVTLSFLYPTKYQL